VIMSLAATCSITFSPTTATWSRTVRSSKAAGAAGTLVTSTPQFEVDTQHKMSCADASHPQQFTTNYITGGTACISDALAVHLSACTCQDWAYWQSN
jgi:hypothetical protein